MLACCFIHANAVLLLTLHRTANSAEFLAICQTLLTVAGLVPLAAQASHWAAFGVQLHQTLSLLSAQLLRFWIQQTCQHICKSTGASWHGNAYQFLLTNVVETLPNT